MSAALASEHNHTPLPPLSRLEKFDKLPPPPPQPHDLDIPPPLPPPKINLDIDPSGPVHVLPPIPTLPSFGNLDHSQYIFTLLI
jgi:hypothetical protein